MTASGTPPEEPIRRVEVPEATVEKVERRMRGTEFESVDAYVSFALDQVLRELDRSEDADGTASPDTDEQDPDDRTDRDEATDQAVAERLESLGYL